MQLNPELVVLSSCQGGVGKYVAGEGILALNRAFMYAGVENIVFSLWKVKDEQTSQMMQQFYQEMHDGKNYAEALRLAKLKILESSKDLPKYWAGFVLNWKQ
jgi:CHAT domain-containing protein